MSGPIERRLFRYAPATRSALVVTGGLGVVGTGLVIAQAGLLAHVLAGAFDGAGVAALRTSLVLLAVVVTTRAAVAWTGERAALGAAARARRELRERTVRAAARPGSGVDTGELVTLATRGLDALDAWFARYLPQLVLAALVPVAVVVLLADADWLSAVVVAITLPLIPLFMVLVGWYTQARVDRQWDQLQRLGGHFLDVVEGLPTLTVFRRARAQVETIRTVTAQHRRTTLATLRIAFLSALVLELLATLATAVVAVEVGLRLLHGDLPYDTALFVLLLAPEAYQPLRQLGVHYHASREGTAAATRAVDLIESVPDEPPAAVLPVAPGEVRTDGVAVRRAGRAAAVLAGLDLRVAPGEHVLVTGASGTGKSTLLGVLLGLVRPDAGRYGVGGRVAWVSQQPYLVAGTLADNVRLGAPGAARDALDEAARLAGLDPVVARSPAGWDTPVGERGLRLSAGERQRVALARAFLRDADVLLLDEPTAHLDPETAAAVRATLQRYCAGRTLIVVAHDAGWSLPRTLRLADGRLEPAGRLAGLAS